MQVTACDRCKQVLGAEDGACVIDDKYLFWQGVLSDCPMRRIDLCKDCSTFLRWVWFQVDLEAQTEDGKPVLHKP